MRLLGDSLYLNSRMMRIPAPLKRLFAVPDRGRLCWEVIVWWEVRRIPYNLVVGAIGFVCFMTAITAFGTTWRLVTRLAPLSFTPAVAHGPIGPCAKTAAQLCVAADVALVYARATQLNTKAFDEHFRRGGSSNLDERADVKAPRTFEKLLGSYPADVQALASAARQWLRKWLPRVEETVDSSAPVIGYGYGPGYRGMVCTLILRKSGVKLGLVRGGELEDPRGLLEGTGKVHRYIQLRTVSDLRKTGVSQLVKAAYTAWQERR